MNTLYLILYIIAAVCFALAALSVAAGKINLIALGLLSWVLVLVIAEARALG